MNQHDLGRIALGAILGVVGSGRDTVSEAWGAGAAINLFPLPLRERVR